MTAVAKIVAALSGRAISTRDEAVLSKHVAQVLTAARIPFEQEVRLTSRDRIDYVVPEMEPEPMADGSDDRFGKLRRRLCPLEQVGIELKVEGSLANIIRQLDRYAQSDRVDALVLVTTRRSHLQVPDALRGKPITVICLGGL
jgi:hypothetical protein